MLVIINYIMLKHILTSQFWIISVARYGACDLTGVGGKTKRSDHFHPSTFIFLLYTYVQVPILHMYRVNMFVLQSRRCPRYASKVRSRGETKMSAVSAVSFFLPISF